MDTSHSWFRTITKCFFCKEQQRDESCADVQICREFSGLILLCTVGWKSLGRGTARSSADINGVAMRLTQTWDHVNRGRGQRWPVSSSHHRCRADRNKQTKKKRERGRLIATGWRHGLLSIKAIRARRRASTDTQQVQCRGLLDSACSCWRECGQHSKHVRQVHTIHSPFTSDAVKPWQLEA